ncbi:hypothetical protein [Clostridium estertheticum]|uniref:hypothetical protein n=1 Tax=Clostridium estertheticum TaxID=238834 RepID=UPI001C0CC246|nr:hypothetical protein [Clostridium estertheticum]MBU3185661.1 hypothetical protein [Clostridium estertheticum]
MATVKHQIVDCDECKHKFKLKPSILKTEKVGEEVERTYFKCPKCKHKFIVAYKDKEFNNNLIEIDNIRRKATKVSANNEELKELIILQNKLHERNLKISGMYKKIYGA